MPQDSSNVLGSNLSLKAPQNRQRPQVSARLSSSFVIMVVPFDASATIPIASDDVNANQNANLIQNVISTPIGFIQSFTPTINRPISTVYQLGQHAIVEQVPGALTGHTLAIGRTFLYQSRLLPVFAVNAMASGGTNILMNYRPFNILVVDRYDQSTILNGFYGCWFTDCRYAITSNVTMVIVEEAIVSYAWVQ